MYFCTYPMSVFCICFVQKYYLKAEVLTPTITTQKIYDRTEKEKFAFQYRTPTGWNSDNSTPTSCNFDSV